MFQLFILEPEVAGGWGTKTIILNRSQLQSGKDRIPIVSYLEYQFDGWEGDDLLTSTPCYIVTEKLAEDILKGDISGYHFDFVDISKGELFEELYPNIVLPSFLRLMIDGTVEIGTGQIVMKWSGHDICLSEDASLVVTQKCLDIMKRHSLNNCVVKELHFVSTNHS